MSSKITYVFVNNHQKDRILIKVGESTDPQKRLQEINSSGPYRFILHKTYISSKQGFEKYLHTCLAKHRCNAEYFIVQNQDDFDEICEQCFQEWKTFELAEQAFESALKENGHPDPSILETSANEEEIKIYKKLKEIENKKRKLEIQYDHYKKKAQTLLVNRNASVIELQDSSGDVGKISWKLSSSERFDSKKAQSLLTDEQLEQCKKTTEIRTMRIY